MKKQLLKKLYAFIITAIMFSASANAQIVYTDVNPDSTLYKTGGGLGPGKIYNLDLNNDGINDFKLTASAGNNNNFPTHYSRSVTASPLNGNAVKDTLVNLNTVSIPLQFNAVIDSNLLLNQSWQTSGSNTLKDTNWFSPPPPPGSGHGLWNNLSDYYLGLRLLQSGQTYYGWVRLRVVVTQSYASLIVKDYAYNSIPNQPILAGQTVATGIIENSFASSIHLFPNPANNQLTIDNGKLKIESVVIYDLTGREVYNENHKSPNANSSISIDVSKFPAGVYAVQIKTTDFVGTKKLVIQK